MATFGKYQILQLVLLTIGVATIMAPLLVYGTSQLGVTLVGLGNAIVASTILVIIHNAWSNDLLLRVEHLIGLRRVVSRAGLKQVHVSTPDEAIFDRFAGARSIDLMNDTARIAALHYGKQIVDAVILCGCRVRVLISEARVCTGDNQATGQVLPPNTDTQLEIQDVLSCYTAIIRSLERHEPPINRGSIEIRTLTCLPTCSLVIVDDAAARYTPHLLYAHSSDVPAFDVAETKGDCLLARYRIMFNTAWAHSKLLIKADLNVPLGDTPMMPVG